MHQAHIPASHVNYKSSTSRNPRTHTPALDARLRWLARPGNERIPKNNGHMQKIASGVYHEYQPGPHREMSLLQLTVNHEKNVEDMIHLEPNSALKLF